MIIGTSQLTDPLRSMIDKENRIMESEVDLSKIIQAETARQLAKITRRRTDVLCPSCFTLRHVRITECDCTKIDSRVER